MHFAPELVHAISNPACIVGFDLTILQANDSFYTFAGLKKSAVCENGLHLDNCLVLNHPWQDDDLILLPFRKKKPGLQNNVIIRNPGQSAISASIQSIPLIGESGTVEKALLIIRDRESGNYKSEQILKLIDRQEEKLKQLDESSEEVSLSTNQLQMLITKQHKQLIEANQTLQQVKEEMNEELDMAMNVQTSLMPNELPDFTNITISSIYIPAGKVGGDFYDIINTQTQKIAILIFDVSGHGVPAALIGATAKMLFAHYIETLESPATIFSEVNLKLCSFLKTDHYLTAFLGILDPIQNKMVYSRAGHVKPIVYHAKQKKVSTLDARGSFIGHSALAQIAEYREDTIQFAPDDKILFYTDGLTEGNNRNNELYGKDRLMKAVKKFGELPLREVLNKIIEDQNRFRQEVELRDDFTMLCIQIGDSEHLLKESGFTKEDAPNILIIHKLSDIEKVCSLILKAMDNFGFPDKDIKRMKVCIFEMAINAVVHGNRNNSNKKALILYKVLPHMVTISVVDDGDGYDHAALPNPLDNENLLKDHGRGVYIVKTYMDEVHFNKKGNRILVKKFHGKSNTKWK